MEKKTENEMKTVIIWWFIGLRASKELQSKLLSLQGVPGPQKTPRIALNEKCAPAAYCQSLEPWARLKFHAGWSGWTRPPTMGGGVGVQGGFKGI